MSTFIEFFDPIAGITVQAMLNSIWQGVLITALVFGLVKLLRRTNAATRYAMWMVTLTAVFCLFLLNVWNAGGGYDLFNLIKLNEETQETVGEMNPDLQQPDQVISSSEKPEETAVPEAENAESLLMTGSEMTSEGAKPNNYQIHLAPGAWHIFVFCAWFLIALFLLLRLIHSYFYSLNLKRSARQLPGEYRKMLSSWVSTPKIRRKVRLCSSEQVTTPVAIGLFNPVVLIPESLLNKLNEAELKQVIEHELAHLKRWDDWTNLLQICIEAVLFFHPAVWWLKNRLNLEREIACDDSIVSKSGENRQYIECLIHLIELVSFSPKPVLASGVLQTKKQIFKRIEALMQTNRTFKIGISIIGICAVLILITIGVYHFTKMPPLVSLEDEQKILTDVLTLEWTFGGEYDTHKEEYLLAQPRGIAANDKGDIFIGDELSIKIFDKNGNEKRIIGRQGQGPGEFTNFMGISWPKLYISPEGFFTVLEQSDTYHVFSPEYLFLIKRNLRNNQKLKALFKDFNLFADPRVNDLISVNEDERIFTISTDDINKRRGLDAQRYDLLFYENADTMFAIQKLSSTNYIPLPSGGLSSGSLGIFRWYLLPEHRLIYTHTGYDIQMNKSESRYILHILSLDTFQETHISHPYIPIAFSDSLINSFNWDRTTEEKRDAKIIRGHYKKVKYFSPIQKIIADGNYVFVFTYQKNDKNDYFTDIFDASTGKYLHSVYFPQWVVRFIYYPDQITIKGGYVYRIKAPFDEFAVVEKYKINPAVYGR